MSFKLYAPNVHLFAFHLQEDEHGNDTDWLWQNCDQIIAKVLQQRFQLKHDWLDVTQKKDSYRIALTKPEKVKNNNFLVSLKGDVNFNSQPIAVTGIVYPLRLFDSYGLWLNLRRPQEENGQKTEDVEIEFLQQLNPDNCLFLTDTDEFLGETLLITAFLTDEDKNKSAAELRLLADACLTAFLPADSLPPFNRSASLIGSQIFEYGLSNLSNYRHILVWLFANTDAEDKLIDKYYTQLIELFFFRNKVISAFKDSRKIYQKLKECYAKIEVEIQILQNLGNDPRLSNDDLDKLQIKIKSLPQLALDHENLLRYLVDFQNTIYINGQNYKNKLEEIQSLLPDENLEFLEYFYQKNYPYFQEQIKVDLGYFQNGSSLLDKAIASIRGIVEIERSRLARDQAELAETDRTAREQAAALVRTAKEKADQQLQNSITSIGTGIAAGSFIASSSGLITTPWRIPGDKDASNYPHPFIISLVLSTVIGLAVWLLCKTWLPEKNK
ncbi:hypothetical protein Cylst_2752 [Cylindrospermum stagnale PCC 7417]|uniref:Uncharacterized protein n=1 Tax=Cylindrospermum stagnale PCC 7417 TaxID=56107 RepID=K9WYQ0_9NOST|nr:hypothetical protein [Cylindrospermum stagnale]AFZ24949.1 hypothetical protein Cylst_2752 [Cylindrospermum stagnale PCC 7417]